MDWIHLAELLGIAAASGYSALQRRRATAAQKAKDAAHEAAELAMQAALDEIEKKANEISATLEDALKKKLGTKTAGGALLTKLAAKREAAIRIGKERALRTYREKMAAP